MKKAIFLIINILSAIVAIIALFVIQIKFSNDNFINTLNSPVYEKTDDFYTLFNNNLNDIFPYINLKYSFEYNGELSYDKTIAESLSSDGEFYKWTLAECMQKAADHGLYIDSSYKLGVINGSDIIKFDKNNTINFLIKTYPSISKNGISTEQDFYTEILNSLADYYKYYDNFLPEATNIHYIVNFTDDFSNDITYTNTTKTSDEIINSQAYIYISSKDGTINSNVEKLDQNIMKNLRRNNPFPEKDFSLYYMIDTSYPINDNCKTLYATYNQLKKACGILVVASSVSMLTFIISLFILLYLIFSSKRKIDDSRDFIHYIPTEFHLLMYVLVTTLLIFYTNKYDFSHYIPSDKIATLKMYLYILIIYITSITFFTILSIKHVNDTLGLALFNVNKNSDENISYKLPPAATLFTMLIPTILFTLVSFYLIYLYTITSYKILLVIGIVLLFSTICFVIYLLLLHRAFKKSLEVQTKSNDMRISLITNVSHDIKTPLTSIINYTGLITQEISSPSKSYKKNIEHYSGIVTEKANRLNDLINELIFESKVSTGNINIDMKPFDIIPFIKQIISEFKDKLNTNKLKVVFEHNKNNILINADDKQLYRVFQNLFANIYKYALENSRVYIDATIKNKMVVITLKNIQKEKLEVDVDTLKDRFVRGKKSRTTEGFGLGLSIAENLIKSMNGTLDIKSIRDEFIVIIKFVPYYE